MRLLAKVQEKGMNALKLVNWVVPYNLANNLPSSIPLILGRREEDTSSRWIAAVQRNENFVVSYTLQKMPINKCNIMLANYS